MQISLSRLTFGLVLVCATWQSSAVAASAWADTFDQYVTRGLPQTFVLPSDPARGSERTVTVRVAERLDSDVEYPDGSHAVTYLGTADGKDATFTRLGDELALDTLEGPSPDDARDAVSLRRQRRSIDLEFGMADAFFPPDDQRSPSAADVDAGSDANTLRFWIFLHDASGETNYAKFHNWYIGWWLRDLEKNVVPGVPIKVAIKNRLPGVTDFDYRQGDSATSLYRFRNAADTYLESIGVRPSRWDKTMLFVAAPAASWEGAYGIAFQADTPSMAAGSGPRHVVAHEFGHTLDALHDLSESRLCGVTNMKGYVLGRFACGYYTRANDQRIGEHVKALVPY